MPPIICATAAIDPMCFEWMPAPKQGRISEQVSLEHLGRDQQPAAMASLSMSLPFTVGASKGQCQWAIQVGSMQSAQAQLTQRPVGHCSLLLQLKSSTAQARPLIAVLLAGKMTTLVLL